MSAFVPIPSRDEVVTRLVKDDNRAHAEALRRVADRLQKTASLPVTFVLAEFGPTVNVQRAVVQALELAGWKCVPTADKSSYEVS